MGPEIILFASTRILTKEAEMDFCDGEEQVSQMVAPGGAVSCFLGTYSLRKGLHPPGDDPWGCPWAVPPEMAAAAQL